jgi:mevalonate pyrophosphate decarboxylase
LRRILKGFAADSSGFSTSTYVRWFDVKYGKNESWHDWVKMHLMCGVKTHIVTSVEISRATAADSPFFKPLLQQTAKAGFTMREVSADKDYTSIKNLQTAA